MAVVRFLVAIVVVAVLIIECYCRCCSLDALSLLDADVQPRCGDDGSVKMSHERWMVKLHKDIYVCVLESSQPKCKSSSIKIRHKICVDLTASSIPPPFPPPPSPPLAFGDSNNALSSWERSDRRQRVARGVLESTLASEGQRLVSRPPLQSFALLYSKTQLP